MILSNQKGLAALLADYGSSERRLPDIAGCYAGGQLVICADAACVWRDLEAFGCRSDAGKGSVKKDGWHFMAVNKIGETFPGQIEHWYSNAAGALGRFMPARRDEYRREFRQPMHSHASEPGASWHWPWPGEGTSGLGAALTGVALGYERIVLCGMPLDDGPHNGEPHWRGTRFTSEARGANGGPEPHWQRAINHRVLDRVRSMSGRTRDWLGDAREWA